MLDWIQLTLSSSLLLWALLSLSTAVVGLYNRPNEFWRACWLMSGIWGLIDGLIAWGALWGARPDPSRLVAILQVNIGLDLLYIAIALVLGTRKRVQLRGFGLGVAVQGGFLLLFDSYFWWLLRVPG